MFHKNPLIFAEWVKKYLGKDKYELLKEARNQVTKFTIEDLEIKLEVLKKMGGKP